MMRSQASQAALAVAGIAFCTAAIFSWDVDWRQTAFAWQQPANVDPQAALAESAKRADRLFGQGKWSEARAAYDEVLRLAKDAESSESQTDLVEAKERAIDCSVKLRDFEGALRRATPFQPAANEKWQRRYDWPTPNNGVDQGPIEEVERLEKLRRSLAQIARELPARGAEQFSGKLTKTRVAVDLDLMKILDPDVIPSPFNWGWAGRYPGLQWWVNALKGRGESDKWDQDESWWDRESIPLTAEGKPVTLSTPAKYEPGLPRSGKILFLMSEVERLDASPNHDEFAKTLLHRADIARRLYGLEQDEAWRMADFEYRYYERPVFHKKRGRRDLKEFWQLEDNEARTLFDGRLRVVRLPDSESPLAIWARIEKEFPHSQAVAEAIYQRGFYDKDRSQFSKAEAEFRRLIARFPHDRRAKSAQSQLAVLEHAGVLLGNTGQYLAGVKPKLWFACRATPKVQFVARRFDLMGYLKNRVQANALWQIAFLDPEPFFHNRLEQEFARDRAPFMGPEVAKWSEVVPRTERVMTRTTHAPITEIGAYVIEARAANSAESSSALVVLTETAIVQKSLPKKVLLWAVNARTGQPLLGQKIDSYTQVRGGDRLRMKRSTYRTDQQGLFALDAPEQFGDFALLETESRGFCVCRPQRSSYGEADRVTKTSFVVTDRPIYRPGSTVNFRVWVREALDREYKPAQAGLLVRIEILGPSSDEPVALLERTTDDSGSVTGSYVLDRDAALGKYRISVDEFSPWRHSPSCEFMVEEYKKPEFEISIQPPKTPPRLGDVITARVAARYYFGAPVAKAKIKYSVSRRPHRVHYAIPREWDWLYGNGFGDYEYWNAWFDGGDMQEEGTEEEPEDRYSTGEELVESGTTELGAEGWADLRIDTARDPRDSDQEYAISVSVQDQSRHSVEAKGSVVASRQAYYAFAELDRGWYEPNSAAAVDLSARSVQHAPVDLEGQLTLSRIVETSGKVSQKIVASWKVRTGPDGHLRFPFRAGDQGAYRLVFESRDAWNLPVRASVNFWVHGSKLDAQQDSGGGLEIIPDQRWYRPGQMARVLIHTTQPNVRLLMWDSFQHYRFVDVPGRARVLEIPLLAKHVPNYFIEATYVAAGQMHSEKCELFVPPVLDTVNIELRPDRTSYQPGDKGRIQIRAADGAGKPVSGSMTLAAYDKALLYFQDKAAEGPRKLLRERKVQFWLSGVTSKLSGRQFSVYGRLVCPEFHLEDGAMPQMGALGGAVGPPGDPAVDEADQSFAIRRLRDQKQDDSSEGQRLPKIRENFADTAAWIPHVTLDKNGSAVAEIAYPDSTTTWRICGYLVTKETHAGEGVSEVRTSRPLLVRLAAPRFVVERDETALSAIVQNELNSKKLVSVELTVPAAQFEAAGKASVPVTHDKDGRLHLKAEAALEAHGSHRFDWPFRARSEGAAAITVTAVCDEGGDGMRLEVPVRLVGTPQSAARAGFSAADNKEPQSFSFELPASIEPSKTQIEVSLAPTASASILDAIPFLAGYPYGCVEQTMSRFYPTVIAADALRKLGLDLHTLAGHGSPSPKSRHRRWEQSPVFDTAELDRMARAGLERLDKFQHQDGGWGWWEHDESTPYMTAYVLLGLDTAARGGVKIDEHVYAKAIQYLLKSPTRWEGGSQRLGNPQETALICYVLSLEHTKQAVKSDDSTRLVQDAVRVIDDRLAKAFSQRENLNHYGKALLALALENQNQQEKARTVLGEITRNIQIDKTRALAWLGTPLHESWRWYDNDIETNAWLLRALVAIDPKSSLTPQIANWLAVNRRHGSYWHSTRDTAQAVHAMADYLLVAKKEGAAFKVDVALDGHVVAQADVDWNKSLLAESRLTLDGKHLKPGRHQLTLTKRQTGPLYYSIAARYFDRSEHIEKAGRGLQVQRRYFRLPELAATTGQRGRSVRSADPPKTPLKDGDTVRVGEIVEAELTISGDRDYEFIAFEDPKPAGFEPVELHSGYTWGNGLWANLELRDEQVVFFSEQLDQGRHVLRYKLRAETPGSFQVRPTHAFDMYNPEIEAHGHSMRLQVRD